MKTLLFKLIRYSGLPFLFRELIQKNKVSILMFHEIDQQIANQVFSYLSRNYNVIPLSKFIWAHQKKDFKSIPAKALVVTFDDGHKSNYELLPVLKKYKIPTTIFLCSGIINTNRHYWFNVAHPVFSTEELKKKTNKEKLQSLAEIGFFPEKEYDHRQALTVSEIEEMKGLVDFQAHTVFHPCLPSCDEKEATFEIKGSKVHLEKEYGLSINALAFPNGDYCERDIEIAKKAGFQCALTVESGFNDLSSDLFKLKRLSTNDTHKMDEFIVRVSGVWGFIKSSRAIIS